MHLMLHRNDARGRRRGGQCGQGQCAEDGRGAGEAKSIVKQNATRPLSGPTECRERVQQVVPDNRATSGTFSFVSDSRPMDEQDIKAKTGVEGLDHVLAGGLAPGRVYLLEGSPGTGKTTIAAQFLLEGASGARPGSTSRFPRPKKSLRETARSHGWAFEAPEQDFRTRRRPKACSTTSSSKACFTRPISNWAKRPSAFSRRSRRILRSGSCSTACRKSGCLRKARCVIGARCSR